MVSKDDYVELLEASHGLVGEQWREFKWCLDMLTQGVGILLTTYAVIFVSYIRGDWTDE